MRIWGKTAEWPIMDLITLNTEIISVGKEFSARSLSDLHKLYKVVPSKVECQLHLVWDGKSLRENSDIKVISFHPKKKTKKKILKGTLSLNFFQ